MATRPTLHVVGKGEPVMDDDAEAEALELAEAMVNSVRAGFGCWLMLDGETPKARHIGNRLEMAALAEEIAREMKCAALGMIE